MFVASLAWCAYWYLVRWSDGSAGGGWAAVAFDTLLLALFGAHHSGFARTGVKRRLVPHVPARLLRSVYVWAAALLLMIVCAAWQRVGGQLYDSRGWWALPHAIVQLAGLWFIARSVATIDPLDLAGIRQIEPPRGTPDLPVAAGGGDPGKGNGTERLRVTGPYRWVRHPLYLGWLLVVFGAAHMTGDRLAFAALTTLYLVVAIPWEEQSLTHEFGEEYERYKGRVTWRLLPYVY